MIRLETTHRIHAPIRRVWNVLTDFASYEAWNPFVVRARGTARVGARIPMRFRTPSGKGFGATVTIVAVESERRLAWRGGVPVLFRGVHSFDLIDDGAHTRIVHAEEFEGLLPRLAGTTRVLSLAPAYEALNQALSRRAESTAPVS
jgi:hypothetical protein